MISSGYDLTLYSFQFFDLLFFYHCVIIIYKAQIDSNIKVGMKTFTYLYSRSHGYIVGRDHSSIRHFVKA